MIIKQHMCGKSADKFAIMAATKVFIGSSKTGVTSTCSCQATLSQSIKQHY